MDEQYTQYLESEQWMETRAKRIALDNNCCLVCKKPFDLQVHHLTYKNLGNESMGDLVTLCKKHHQDIELVKKKNKTIKAQLDWITSTSFDSNYARDRLSQNYIESFYEQKEAEYKDLCKEINNTYFLNKVNEAKKFIEANKKQDISFGGPLNFCKIETIKEHLGKWLQNKGYPSNCSGLITFVQAYFRNRKYEVIFALKESGYNMSQIITKTGFNNNMVFKCFKNPKEKINDYKTFESEWQGKPKEEITMQKPTNYENTQAIQERVPAEVGGHYLRIIRVVEMKNKNGGDMIMVGYDFAANDKQAGLYQKEFEANTDTANRKWPIGGRNYMNVYDQNGQCSKSFKGFCESVEQSNPGFKIDWNLADWGSQFSKKLVGAVYGNVENEYNGKCYLRSQLRWFVPNDKVASAKAPKDKYLNNNTQAQTVAHAPTKQIPDEDLPF